MITVLTYIIVCPLVFCAGFVDAVAGGGGLISLPAYLISGLPVHLAIGTNKCSSAMGTALATYRFGKIGYIKAKQSLSCAVFALMGSFLGARIALLIEDRVFKGIMLVVLPLTALYVLRSRHLEEERVEFGWKKTAAISMAVAFSIGVYDGFYGPGTGTFLLLLLTGLAHMKLNLAAGTTKVINLTTNLTALSVFLVNRKVLIPLGLAAGCFSIAGNYIGTRFFQEKGARSVKPLIVVVLLIFFVKVLWEMFL